MASQVYLSLGTNLGQRRDNLQRAVEALGAIMAVDALSPIYETEPWGVTDQPDFLNICLGGKTALNPHEFFRACKEIELETGRQPGPRWGPRLIDIDIIFFDNLILDDEWLSIPHPGFRERAFVLVPLFDIAPNLVDPSSGASIHELMSAVDVSTVEQRSGPSWRLRRPKTFAWGAKTYVMGILNVTPDSFSGDGLLGEKEWVASAVDLAKAFASAGADILDIGGVSTRPGSTVVAEEEELARVLPVIKAVHDAVDIPLSVDTYRAGVAKEALASGADWVNDVWGLRMDSDMAHLIAQAGCPIVVMHNRSKPQNVDQQQRLGGRYVGVHYEDLLADVQKELLESIKIATEAGIGKEQIVIDPGIGFGKTVSQNIQLLNELDRLLALGYPILVGTSRKSFIGYTLDKGPDERLQGTAATVTIAIDRGADIVRVHDVEAMVQISQMTDRIVR